MEKNIKYIFNGSEFLVKITEVLLRIWLITPPTCEYFVNIRKLQSKIINHDEFRKIEEKYDPHCWHQDFFKERSHYCVNWKCLPGSYSGWRPWKWIFVIVRLDVHSNAKQAC